MELGDTSWERLCFHGPVSVLVLFPEEACMQMAIRKLLPLLFKTERSIDQENLTLIMRSGKSILCRFPLHCF
jgi:hypothetical protein